MKKPTSDHSEPHAVALRFGEIVTLRIDTLQTIRIPNCNVEATLPGHALANGPYEFAPRQYLVASLDAWPTDLRAAAALIVSSQTLVAHGFSIEPMIVAYPQSVPLLVGIQNLLDERNTLPAGADISVMLLPGISTSPSGARPSRRSTSEDRDAATRWMRAEDDGVFYDMG